MSMLQRFTLRGYFQAMSEDVPWTADFEGHPLLNLFFFSTLCATFSALDLALSSSAWPRLCTRHCSLRCTLFPHAVQQFFAEDVDWWPVLEPAVLGLPT